MRTYDLVVLGAGSGNMLFGPELDHLKVALVEPDRFGGTCLNRGCIPSKMFVVAADAAVTARESGRLGVHARIERVDWTAIRDRVFGRIDPIHDSGLQYRRSTGVDVFTDPARFVGPKVLSVGEELVTAEQIVVAVGARPVVPRIPGLDRVAFHTSDTIMRVDRVPESLLIVGGGFIAAEMGHVFGAFGSQVTIVQRGPRLLMGEDEQVATRFTELAGRRHRVLLDSEVVGVEPLAGGADGAARVSVRRAATVTGPERVEQIEVGAVLVAAGRLPNTDRLDAAAAGLELDGHGHLVTDGAYRTNVPGVWAFGDVANHFQLKHMANAEMRVVRHNLLHPDTPQTLAHDLVPHAVFSEPQIASVGLTEQQAREAGRPYLVSVRDYADTAYGWALEDTTSFVKLLADPATRLLLGAHIIGPQAAALLQPLLQAMTLGLSVDRIGRDVLYIHPALTEVVEQALLEL